MKKRGLFFLFIGIITLLMLFSCEKIVQEDSDSLSSNEISSLQNDLFSDDIFNEVDAAAEDELTNLDQENYLKSVNSDYSCLTITVEQPDTSCFPKTITLDYGEGCTAIFNDDTITKKGIIQIILTDKRYVEGSQQIISFNEFYFNDIKVEGTRTSTYQGTDENGYYQFSDILESGKLSFPDGTEYTQDADWTKLIYRGTYAYEDSIFLDGSSWGTNTSGESYTRETIEPLTLAHCPDYGNRWIIVDGILQSTVDGVVTQIDYSDSSCERYATIRRNGKEYRIRIQQRNNQ